MAVNDPKSSFTYTDALIELSVTSFAEAKNFYSILGFEKVWEEEAKGMNGYLVMKRENSVLCFFCGNEEVYNHPYFVKFPKTTVRGYGVEISIPVEKIDEFWLEIKDKIPENQVFQELRLQPWGVKDLRLVDPFGYFLRFNEPTNFLNPVLLGDNEYGK